MYICLPCFLFQACDCCRYLFVDELGWYKRLDTFKKGAGVCSAAFMGAGSSEHYMKCDTRTNINELGRLWGYNIPTWTKCFINELL